MVGIWRHTDDGQTSLGIGILLRLEDLCLTGVDKRELTQHTVLSA